MLQFALALFLVLGYAEGATPNHDSAIGLPIGSALDQFPIEPGPLSPARQKELGLHETKLGEWAYTPILNWHRQLEDGRFVLERLPYDTEVLSDKEGIPRYKKDCGNRLIVWPQSLRDWQKPVGDMLSNKSTTDDWRFPLLWLATCLAGLIGWWLRGLSQTPPPPPPPTTPTTPPAPVAPTPPPTGTRWIQFDPAGNASWGGDVHPNHIRRGSDGSYEIRL